MTILLRRSGPARASVVALGLSVLLVLGAACSSGSDGKATDASSSSSTTTRATTPAAARRPVGPIAELSALTGGSGAFLGESEKPELAKAGYVEEEFAAEGTATSYAAQGEQTGDGRWTFAPADSAPYRTRVLVRRPKDPKRFSGTTVVEWLNVSGGLDAGPDWTSLEEEIVRRGDAWVGVSAQLIGVEGGPVLVKAPGAEQVVGKGLKTLDPARYSSLSHPGDGYAFDIYTQVARAVRSGKGLGGAESEQVLAAGESQSAIALTTYYNGVQPLTKQFDGFLVHSRAGVSLPLVGPGEYADLAGSITGSKPVTLRTDQSAPVMELQAETDVTGVLKSFDARQPDSDTFRLWEVAGTAHADAHLIGPTIAAGIDCGAPINAGPMHLVAKAAYRDLVDWSAGGDAPPTADRLEVSADGVSLQRDADGIALGGIRTPPLDVPVDVLSGVPGPNPDLICILLGTTKPLSAERLAQLYPSRAAYQQRYRKDADHAIAAGFVLPADRAALLTFSRPEAVPAN